MEQQQPSRNAVQFLFNKSVFLLTSSVGKAMAENLVVQATARIGTNPASLATDDIARLAATLEPELASFVGNDKARRLASALRVMVGAFTAT
jgi:hypothetical protein